jgi:hypothetical protein
MFFVRIKEHDLAHWKIKVSIYLRVEVPNIPNISNIKDIFPVLDNPYLLIGSSVVLLVWKGIQLKESNRKIKRIY